MSTEPTTPETVFPPPQTDVERFRAGNYQELLSRAADIALVLTKYTSEPWKVVQPETLEIYAGIRLEASNDKVFVVSRDRRAFYERRLRVNCVYPGPDSRSSRLTSSYNWNREAEDIARDFLRKHMSAYVQALSTSKKRAELAKEAIGHVLKTVDSIAKILKAPSPAKPERYYNRATVRMCACSAESVSGAVQVEAPCISIEGGKYGPPQVKIEIGNLKPDEAKTLLRLAMKIHNQRERNIKRRKPKPVAP